MTIDERKDELKAGVFFTLMVILFIFILFLCNFRGFKKSIAVSSAKVIDISEDELEDISKTSEEELLIQLESDDTTYILETQDDYELEQKRMLAALVQAEAGNQPLTGMRFVVDVVLNRVDDPRFPDTIEEVIFQKNQFSVTTNGAFNNASLHISDEAWMAVELEWEERLDYGIIFFSSTTDPINGKNAFKYYDHWFSY